MDPNAERKKEARRIIAELSNVDGEYAIETDPERRHELELKINSLQVSGIYVSDRS